MQQTSAYYSLCELFGLSTNTQEDYPIAALARLTEDDKYPSGFWLRADPVHIKANKAGLILFDNSRFDLSQRDALTLVAEISPLLEPYGISIEVPVPERWYLHINENISIKTTPIDAVMGKNILSFMPISDDRINLIQLMNDIQMVLHNADINQRREAEKQLPINSIWFWGYGKLPNTIAQNWSFVMSDEILAPGLAKWSTTPFQALPENYSDVAKINEHYRGLIVLSALQKHKSDSSACFEALLTMEKSWFLPLRQALTHRQIDQLIIKTELNEIKLGKWDQYKLWKQKKTLNSFELS